MERRYLSLMVVIGLSGAFLALLGFLLAPGTRASPAPRPELQTGGPNLVIDVQAADEMVLASQPITYALLYTNTLGQALSDVIITSTLSIKQTYSGTYLSDPIVSTDNFTYSGSFDDGYILTWWLGSLPAHGEGWIVVTTTLPPEAEPPWDDRYRWPLLGASAVITTSTSGVTVGNPEGLEGDSASVMVVGPVLEIIKVDDPDPARPGRLLTYTLTVENKDREDAIAATGIVITDPLPANTIFHSASDTGAYSPTTGLVSWHPSDPLERASTMAVTFTVRLSESMPSCSVSKFINGNYGVQSAEMIQVVTGFGQWTDVGDVLEKTIETPGIPSGVCSVFPGGIVTYTISIYNPRHDQPVTGLRLTDTLPGEPNPFSFLNMVDGDAPLITPPDVVWDNLSVPAGGVKRLSFRAQVPYHIIIDPDVDRNKTYRIYENNLSASVPGLILCDMKDPDPSQARVTRQIELRKVVEPDHVLSGEKVVYTITLENMGDTAISSIRLTDTLPNTDGANFYFVRMMDGPEPVAEYRHNPVVWDGLSVEGNGETSLSFEAVAIGWPLEMYGNHLSAISPWTTIPDRVCTRSVNKDARVTIDSPLTINKTVEPSQTFVNESVRYDVQICNVATGTYTIDQFSDYLPTGFYVGGMNPYVFGISPARVLAPGDCWTHSFDADVMPDVGCSDLPETYENEEGSAQVHVTDPVVGWFINADDLAPLRVNPHVTIAKQPNHTAVLPGETFVYVITLDNASSVQVGHVMVIEILPDNFQYLEMVTGADPTDTEEPVIVWENQTVPAGGQLELAFLVQVPLGTSLDRYKNQVDGTTTEQACIKGVEQTAPVDVVDQIIEMTKQADPEEVPPLGILRYEIELENKDSVPVTGVTVNETLPGALGKHFEFVGMVEGDPEPTVNGRQVTWSNLTVPGDTTLRLRFDARAVLFFGNYDNELSASCPRTPITPEQDDIQATVTVLPGVILYKTVFPTQTVNGGTVVYTVTLNNQSDQALENVRITDTLPSGFAYRQTIAGPIPVQIAPVVVWELGRLKKKTSQDFVFRAQVGSFVITGTYFNQLEGYSPSAMIPGVAETAPVEVSWMDRWLVYLPLLLRNYP